MSREIFMGLGIFAAAGAAATGVAALISSALVFPAIAGVIGAGLGLVGVGVLLGVTRWGDGPQALAIVGLPFSVPAGVGIASFGLALSAGVTSFAGLAPLALPMLAMTTVATVGTPLLMGALGAIPGIRFLGFMSAQIMGPLLLAIATPKALDQIPGYDLPRAGNAPVVRVEQPAPVTPAPIAQPVVQNEIVVEASAAQCAEITARVAAQPSNGQRITVRCAP